MRIVIVTDAWFPQVNGVVRTLSTLRDRLDANGHAVCMVTPAAFRTVPCPTYPEIRLSLWPWAAVPRMIRDFGPDAIHIATEGPLGVAARVFCRGRGLPFTTAYHTRFPEYLKPRFGVPLAWTYGILRWFHGPSRGIMVATPTIEQAMLRQGFRAPIKRWTRGVDTALFQPHPRDRLDFPRPILMFTGRVAVEKNIEAFLALDLPGTKVVVGDGPQRPDLERRYPQARFVGARHGEDLARHYAAADVFVFPSRTDTFGLVLLEAMACGTPAAAYPVPGPLDVIGDAPAGALDEDLGRAVTRALAIPRETARAYAEGFSWQRSVAQFLGNLHPFDPVAAFGAVPQPAGD